jgi:signal transduction histidine kinase
MNAPQALPHEDVFVDLLANSVHDLKNSLGLVLSSAEVVADSEHLSQSGIDSLHLLQHYARRVNNELVSLLGLYKLQRGRTLVHASDVDCEAFLAEIAAYNEPLLTSRGLVLETGQCAAAEGYFDRFLVASVLNSAINNSFRYAHSRVTLDCRCEDGCLVFSVTDDGEGYPARLLGTDFTDIGSGDRQMSGTGLGLYFASRVAELHVHRDRAGWIRTDNVPGARLEIHLP